MPANDPRRRLEDIYDEAAREYERSLPLEHYAEATSQATQREMTLASLALVEAKRTDIQVFNELLVQYPVLGSDKPGQVVPDAPDRLAT